MNGFRARLDQAINGSDYKDRMHALTEHVDCGQKTIYNMLQNSDLDTSKVGPGFFLMARIAKALDCSLDYLAGNILPTVNAAQPEDQTTLSPKALAAIQAAVRADNQETSVETLLRLHAKSGGRIEAFSSHIHKCDTYKTVKRGAKKIEVLQVGQDSLAAATMGHSDGDTLQRALDEVGDAKLKKSWLRDYREATERGTLCTNETLNVQMPNQPTLVKLDFVRCLLRVEDADKNSSILNFSFRIV